MRTETTVVKSGDKSAEVTFEVYENLPEAISALTEKECLELINSGVKNRASASGRASLRPPSITKLIAGKAKENPAVRAKLLEMLEELGIEL